MQGRGIRTLLLASLAGCALLCPAQSAHAQATLDANCPQLGGGNYVVDGDQRAGQSFVVAASGKLTSAQIRITKNVGDGTGDYIIQLLRTDAVGNPGDGAVFTTIVPEAAVPGGSINLLTTATFSPPLSVTAGDTYALVVTRPGSGANGLRLNIRPGSDCPGSLYNSLAQGGPFTITTFDLIFATFVDRPSSARIRKHPPKRSEKDVARFKFSADEPNSTFRCSLDQRKSRPCKSPKRYRGLDDGKHFFAVSAVDSAGSTGRVAAFGWKVNAD